MPDLTDPIIARVLDLGHALMDGESNDDEVAAIVAVLAPVLAAARRIGNLVDDDPREPYALWAAASALRDALAAADGAA